MTATYTVDLFASLDGYGSYAPPGDWGGYWGKQGPELLARRAELYAGPLRMVLGATTFRELVRMLGEGSVASGVLDPWVDSMRRAPATVVSSTLAAPLDWPDATVADGVDVVRALKEASDVPLRSHGSLTLNRALRAAGLVDRLQVTVFPVVTGRTGDAPGPRRCARPRPRPPRAPRARWPHRRARLPAAPALSLVRRRAATAARGRTPRPG